MKFLKTGLALLPAIFAVTLLNTPETSAKRGGPDDFGYVYIDSNESPVSNPGGASRCNTAFVDISATGTPLNLTSNEEANVTTPFAITLYDTTTTDMRIGNNGGVVLGTTTGDIYGVNRSLPTIDRAFANGPGVVPFWDNLGDASGNVYTETTGVAPNRKFIVQWENRPYLGGDVDTATFQVVFYEGISRIDFVYEDVNFSNATHDYGASATIGLNQDDSNALQYSYNEASLNTPSPVAAICFEKPTISLKVTAGADLRINGDPSTGGAQYKPEAYTLHMGENVGFCYKVSNTSSFTDFPHQSLVSSEHGNILNNFPYMLTPGSNVFINEWSDNIDAGFTETATWSTEESIEATSSAVVNIVGFTCSPDKPLTQKYMYDFEADNGGGIGTNDWEWGAIPEVSPPEHSGSKVWTTVLDGPYNNLNDHILLTFELDLRKISAPVGLLWKQTLQAKGSGFDFATITANGDIEKWSPKLGQCAKCIFC